MGMEILIWLPGNFAEINKVYRNNGDATFTNVTAGDLAIDSDRTSSIAWGDMDNDGDLDLAVGNDEEVNKVYQNDGNGVFTDVTDGDLALIPDDTTSVAWGDWDGDGDLDLVSANFWIEDHCCNILYRNDGSGTFTDITERPWAHTDNVRSISFGDADGDGDLDLLGGGGVIYRSGRQRNSGIFPNTSTAIHLTGPYPASANFFAASDILDSSSIPISYTLLDDAPVGYIEGQFSVNGGGKWQTAVATTDTITTNLPPPGGPSFGLVGHWRFDDRSGSVAQDSSKNLYNGSLLGNPAFTNGFPTALQSYSSGSLDFDGAGDYVDLGNQLDNTFADEMSVSLWFKEDANPTGTLIHTLLSKANYNGDNTYFLWLRGPDSGQHLRWSVEDNLGALHSCAYADFPAANEWHHIVGTFSSQSIKVYLDGEEICTNTISASSVKITSPLAARIGASHWVGGDYFPGLIDDVRIYDRALLPEEVGQLNSHVNVFRWDTFASGFFGQSDNVTFRLLAHSQLPTMASSNPLLFTETFETAGLANWTATGFWNLESETDSCGALQASFPSSNTAVYYGQDGICNYDNLATNTGTLLLNNGLDLLPGTGTNLSFSYVLETENGPPYDAAVVEMSTTGSGGPWQIVDDLPNASSWTTRTVNLSSYAGQTIHLRFRFDSVDDFANNYFGWLLDDIRLEQTFAYHNHTPFPMQRPSATAVTFPFRVRGTQIRVYDQIINEANAVEDAIVYQLPAGQTSGGKAIADSSDHPFQTNNIGYLQGRGELNIHDQLVAMRPISTSNLITFTDKISLYHISAAASPSGLAMFEVITPGVQSLIINPDNKLMLLNLDVSLEWDARQDPDYLTQLQSDLARASEILFDLSNGQIALGEVTVYQNKENWLSSDILVYARNDQRPNANLGGITEVALNDVLSNTQVLTGAYLPGQIRMGATWNRYGNPGGTVGEDWPRALAHEIGHYSLFLLDNYLGISANELLVEIDCQGSAMTDAYRTDYSEFLDRNTINGEGKSWSGACLNSLAEQTTGRSDWETINAFYSFLSQQSDKYSQWSSQPAIGVDTD